MGAQGESGRCPFTEQADRELVCLIARASAFTDRRFDVSSCPLGAGSARGRTCAVRVLGT